MITKEEVKNILRQINYADTQKNIMDLGMVQQIKIQEEKLTFSLLFQKSDDPELIPLKKECVKKLRETLDKNIKIQVNIRAADMLQVPPLLPSVENTIAIASGKGGVGKSTVSVNLAVALSLQGYKVGLVDADIFGPSIPTMFGVKDARPIMTKVGDKDLIAPIEKYGVKMLSIGFFVAPNQATVWRGPMAANALRQMMAEGDWGELDYLLIDLPPGTSDIHLSLVQMIALTGAIIVSTPQEVALADAVKGMDMFQGKEVGVPIWGLIENMSWFTPEELPNNKYYLFGKDGGKKLAEERKVPFLGQLPIVQSAREGGDSGVPVALNKDSYMGKAFGQLAQSLVLQVGKRHDEQPPTEVVQVRK